MCFVKPLVQLKPRQKTVPIGKESEAYRPGFTNKSGRERKPEAFILGENKKSTGYGPSGSAKPPRCLPGGPFPEHCKDTS